MSSLPVSNNQHNNIVYQEILAPAQITNGDHSERNVIVVDHQQNLETQLATVAGEILDRGLKSMKIRTKTKKKNSVKYTYNANAALMEEGEEEEGSLDSKKLDHNAKERIRRMKLNASYLALRALLPDSKRSKKRLGAPAIVDRVLKYIPEMENEIEELKSNKENAQTAANNKINTIIASSSEYQNDPTVSVNKVNEEEVIVQICMTKEENDHDQDGILAFTNLLQNLEDDHGICIKNASTNYVCETRICYHLHIQINETSSGADDIQELRNKVISMLR